MRTPEDPTRDPASEARDDHSSEPRATPETDAEEARMRDGGCPFIVTADFARRLERQRDQLLEALERIAPRTSDKWARDACEDAIAAVKGGTP